jgi:DNA-binding NarL/FixJ family response regulator
LKKKITVLLVDDHTLVRRGFRRLLEDEEDLQVVGEAADGETGVRLFRELKPRVVLMDYSLPGINGIVATKDITASSTASNAQTGVIMLSMHCDASHVRKAQEAGARGYLEKNVYEMDLVTAIRRVAQGETVFPTDLGKPTARTSKPSRELSPREREVLKYIVEGKSNRDIAAHLDLSVYTVGAHRAKIMKTLGVHKSSELVAYALRNRLVKSA